MKKFSLVVLVLLLIGMSAYGQWENLGNYNIKYGDGFSFHNGGHKALGFGIAPGVKDLNTEKWGAEIRLNPHDGKLLFGITKDINVKEINNLITGTKDGYVGIGTSSPAERLHINGAIRGNERNGALKVSTTSGYLTLGPKNSGWCHFETDREKFHFNKEIRVESGKIGSYSEDLQLKTNGTTRMIINENNGNIGIGTLPSSTNKLDVYGTVSMTGFRLFGNTHEGFVLTSDANGVGTWEPASGGGSSIWSKNSSNEAYYMGNVGIGTKNPGAYKLAINGKIRAKEVRVETNWSDFVFEDDYKLMPLPELEKHIKENKHLPGIPTGKEVQKDGIEVGKIQAKLLEKVEELTLYVIELEKKNEELQKRICALETK